MSRLQDVFTKATRPVLNVYCTAGFPHRDSTLTVINALQQSGADIIELGMPYSDPLADGPVIQASSSQALANGMTIPRLFEQLQNLRPTIKVPIVLMGYLNPVLQYGFEKFCADAAAVGVDGLIIPDIPVSSFEREYRPILQRHGLDFIFLVTPETPEDRVRKLDSLSSGFLYAVSSSSVTGAAKELDPVQAYLQRLQGMSLKNPVLVGFGIRDRKSFEQAAAYSAGAIIGSAYIQALQKDGTIEAITKSFVQSIRPT